MTAIGKGNEQVLIGLRNITTTILILIFWLTRQQQIKQFTAL